MQIQLKQNDIELAIRQYMAKMGIARNVENIEFTVTRKGGTTITAEIELADLSVAELTQTAPVAEAGCPTALKPECANVPSAEANVVPEPVIEAEVPETTEEEESPLPDQNTADEQREEEAPATQPTSLFG